MEPLIFLGGVAVGVGVLMVAFQFQDSRREREQRENRRRHHTYERHLRVLDADSHRYLRADDRRPE